MGRGIVAARQSKDEGKQYVLVGDEEESAPSDTVPASPENEPKEETKCPEILYKVQYKDFSGEIKGTKELAAPYQMKKTTYGGSGIPILEVLYSVTVWFPTIYKKGRGMEKKEITQDTGGENKEEFDERSMEEKELIIHSQHIIQALRAVVDYYPGQSLLGDTISIKEPFSILVHFRKELQEYKENIKDLEAKHHLEVLQKYLLDNLGEKILSEDERYEKATPVATFEMLWMLYKPGMDVYATIDDQRAGFVVQSCASVIDNNRGFSRTPPLKVTMWYLDFDGRTVGRRPYEVSIVPFEGEREISSLKVVPASFVDSNDLTQRTKLEDRGEKFFGMLLGKQMDYKGFSMLAKQKPRRYHEGRVVVDQGSFYTYADWQETELHPAPNLGVDDDNSGILRDLHYDCTCDECMDKRRAASGNTKWGTYENIDPTETTSLGIDREDGSVSRHRYFLCPRRIMGFDLKSKKWQALDVECCHAPRIKTEAIENLVLPTDKLELIKALVHKFTSTKSSRKTKKSESATWSADPIPNKGEGQIFLLHGPPGAGKTFTAECVAEFTSRPLLSLTCGDIGLNEYRVEEQLSKWFKLAEIWGAVMLIDEADVYLERREVNELDRNGLVSVFLRAMEYYRGILFLTTNRVGHFDPAFFSRIHVYIGYRPLDASGRKRIWVQFFEKLERERGDELVIKAAAKRYTLSDDVLNETEWNGREIRNAFQTAVALAEYEAEQSLKKPRGQEYELPLPPKKAHQERDAASEEELKPQIELRQDHFEKVVEMSDNFKKYLATVGPDGMEKDKAKMLGERGDDSLL